MRRLFSCSVSLVYADAQYEVRVHSFVADRAEFWWDVKRPAVPVLWDSTIQLGEQFFNEIIAHPAPIYLNTLKALKRSPLGLDLYTCGSHLSHVRTQATATPHVAATLPAVRRGPGEGEQSCSAGFPPGLSTRVKENKERLAGPALPYGQGGAAAFSVAAAHRAVATTPRGIAVSDGTSY